MHVKSVRYLSLCECKHICHSFSFWPWDPVLKREVVSSWACWVKKPECPGSFWLTIPQKRMERNAYPLVWRHCVRRRRTVFFCLNTVMWRDVSLAFSFSSLTFYCHCKYVNFLDFSILFMFGFRNHGKKGEFPKIKMITSSHPYQSNSKERGFWFV